MTQIDINGLNQHKYLFKSIFNHSKVPMKIIYQKILLLYNLKHCATAVLS